MIGLIITATVGYGAALLFAAAAMVSVYRAYRAGRAGDHPAFHRRARAFLWSITLSLALATVTRMLTGGVL